ncbi:uncharacterized protein DNG_00767 [Cephalotrichum gorgonifer]|uniref:Uncharacterized protein n=1 Tax=Cephalotrichum gorgonifer TaxID=2041049 RepID=A0AAE8MRL7_9PEZI|nr:uncharacterized protein DNG_00767 [Cephalotrichum gorgonifer]
MPPKRRTAKARGKAPARNPPVATIRAVARLGRSLKRRMIAKLIALEEEQGETREIPRDVDLQCRYTRANVERYMGSRLGAALEQRKGATAEQRKEMMTPRRSLRSAGSDSGAGTSQGNRRRNVPGVRRESEVGGQVVVETVAKPPTEFMTLPTEVRLMIYRHLLISDDPIKVHSGWAIVYRHQRNRASFDTTVLRTCRICFAEGVRVLYGENEFEYLIRDAAPVQEASERIEDPGTPQGNTEATPPLTSHPEEEENSNDEYHDDDDDTLPDVQATATTATQPDSHDINISKVGPLMRRLSISAEANRSGPEYSQTMARAITTLATLRPTRANVHTLRIKVRTAWREETKEVALADWFMPGTAVMVSIIKLPVRFIKFEILTPSGREVCVEVNRGYGTATRRARRGDPRYVQDIPAVRRERDENAKREYGVLMGISGTITNEGWKDRLEVGDD